MLKDVKNPRARAPELASEAAERRAAERWTLGEAAAELSEQSSGVMSPDDWITILEELVPAEVLHSPGGEMQANEVNALLEAHPHWSTSTLRLPSARQTDLDTMGWEDSEMHAAYWFEMAAVSPREAASLLCQSDPLDTKADPDNTTYDETGPEDFKLLLRVFSDVEQSDPKRRTLIEWFTIAEARRCKHHSWLGRYLAARERLGFPVVPTHAGGPEHQDGKPAPQADIQSPAAPVVTPGASKATGWTLSRPQRFQGYGKPLHDLLKAAHIAGKSCPKAREVLDEWKLKPPPEVLEVTNDGLKYYDAKGNAKPADLDAIRKAIDRLVG